MFEKLVLKSSPSAAGEGLSLLLEPSITIFVGPNNSGKSLLLREINSFCQNGNFQVKTKILDSILCKGVDHSEAKKYLESITRDPKERERVHAGWTPVILRNNATSIDTNAYYMCMEKPNKNIYNYSMWYLNNKTLNIDGSTRASLLNSKSKGDLKFPDNSFAKLLTNDNKRKKWRGIIYECFNIYPAIDASEGASLRIRFSKELPPDELSLRESTLDWMRNAIPIESVSDGVKAFSGILLEIYGGDPEVIIIDEPEAFLHPSLAQRLGKELAEAARTERKYVFASTHSAHFLMGAIQSGATVNIIRLTWDGTVATARLLPNDKLKQLMNDPMLRSVGMLSGLFFQNVLVTEGDSDRAFYQEINERLLAESDERAIPHALFLNADNHQTIPKIVEPLRKLGIAAAGIADLDVISKGGKEWTKQLRACGMPEGLQESNKNLRNTVFEYLKKAAPEGNSDPEKYFKTNGGINLLSGKEKETAESFCNDLEKYGLFLVRKGEVEAWLKNLGVEASKHNWREKIFKAMGSDPESDGYVKPDKTDVWNFLGHVHDWLTNPDRKGIPD